MEKKPPSSWYSTIAKQKTIIVLQVCITILWSTLPFSTTFAQAFIEQQFERGIDHVFKHQGFIGGGATFFDFDNDGDQDLYITAGLELDHFYVNDGSGHFSLQSEISGFGITRFYNTMGVIAGDIDNDGFTDLYVTTLGNSTDGFAKNLLFKNNGNGTFFEIWPDQSNYRRWSVSATFLDFNLDGLLDIYVGNYVDRPEIQRDGSGNIIAFNHDCFDNQLFLNKGDATFAEVSKDYGMVDTGCSLAVTGTDYDDDGDLDILVANDFGPFIEPNKIFKNLYPLKRFEEVGTEINANQSIYGMGFAIGDLNEDDRLDYYVSNLGSNPLLINQSTQFDDLASSFEISNETNLATQMDLAVSWGSGFFDFDLDTDLDLYVANGYVPGADFIPTNIRDQDAFFKNIGNQTFVEQSAALGILNEWVSRGVSIADVDNDGDLDILTVIMNAPMTETERRSKLFINNINEQEPKNWLKVKLEGINANYNGIGARVELYINDNRQIREIDGGSSHCSQHAPIAHFGLDDITEIDSLVIKWPGNKTQTEYQIPINQQITITEDLSQTTDTKETHQPRQFGLYPNPTSGHVYISNGPLTNEEILVFDLLGQIQPSKMHNGRLDLNQLTDGIYLIKIGHEFIQKIIKY